MQIKHMGFEYNMPDKDVCLFIHASHYEVS